MSAKFSLMASCVLGGAALACASVVLTGPMAYRFPQGVDTGGEKTGPSADLKEAGDQNDPQAVEIIQKTIATYRNMRSYSSEGTVRDEITQPENYESSKQFTIKLKRPNLYKVVWHEVGFTPMFNGGEVTNAGNGAYLSMSGGYYRKMANNQEAISSVAGVSSMAASFIPAVFFDGSLDLFRKIKNLKIVGSERVDGQDCFVISGYAGRLNMFWISKDNYYIVKHFIKFMKGESKPDLSDAAITKALKQLGFKADAATKAEWKQMLVAGDQVEGAHTENYSNIVKDAEIDNEEFEDARATREEPPDPCAAKDAGAMIKEYYPNGDLHIEGHCKDGRLHGVYKQFSQDGAISVTVYFNGFRQGPYRQYYPNGRLYMLANNKDDHLDGSMKVYNKDGTLDHEGRWKDGETLDYMHTFKYYDNGKIKTEFYYNHQRGSNTVASYQREFFENGQLHTESRSIGRDNIAAYKEYDVQGKLIVDQKHGFTGIRKFFYDDGKLETESRYKRGKLVESTSYYPDGRIENVLKNGQFSSYDQNGKAIFENDKRIWLLKALQMQKAMQKAMAQSSGSTTGTKKEGSSIGGNN